MRTEPAPGQTQPTDPRRPWRAMIGPALIILAGAGAYWNSFSVPFVFDDVPSIPGNPTIRDLADIGRVLRPPQRTVQEGRPVVNLSAAVNYALHGLEVWGYHAANLAVHLAAALTLYGLVRRTLALPDLRELFAHPPGPAAAAGLIWAVHPLQTESVTYVIQRAESLMGLFYLLTLYCLLRGAQAARGRWWYAASVAACALGMGSKEVMVSAPAMALLYDRIFLSGSFRQALRRRWALYAALAATWGILAVGVVASWGRSGTTGAGLFGLTPWNYTATQCRWVFRYLGLAFWPHPLVFDYGLPDAGVPVIRELGQWVPWGAAAGALLAATAAGLRYRPRAGFLGLCFFAVLAPSSSFVPVATEMAAEHRMYLPLAAVVVLAVTGGLCAWRRLLTRLGRLRFVPADLVRWAPAAVVAGVVLALSHVTFIRNQDYRSEIELWERNISDWPGGARAYHNLAVCYTEAVPPQAELAVRRATRAVELKPDYHEAYNSRAVAYALLGQFGRTSADADKAIQLQPRYATAYSTRGNAHFKKGDIVAAVADYTRAVEIDPSYAAAYGNRAVAYYHLREYDKARQDLRTCRELGGRCSPDLERLLLQAAGQPE